MPDRKSASDNSEPTQDVTNALKEANRRAERAERELARLKQGSSADQPAAEVETPSANGEAALRSDSMMAHLLDSLDKGQDIGHYGRLVFAMVARHFLAEQDLLAWLLKDRTFDEAQAHALIRQVASRDYNPPRRERILEWQSQQEFPILPHPEDPDCGNVYRNLKFPDSTYHHIEEYQEQKANAEDSSAAAA